MGDAPGGKAGAKAATTLLLAAGLLAAGCSHIPAMPYKRHLPEGAADREQTEAPEGALPDEPASNGGWPRNYVDAVEREADSGRWAYILCPSDPLVLDILPTDGREVYVVVPEPSLKEECRRRLIARGSAALVGRLIDGGAWERSLASLGAQCRLHAEMGRDVHFSTLGSGRYLLQVM